MFDGGMMSPVVAAVVVTATLNSRLYPIRGISGIMKPPTLETAAVADADAMVRAVAGFYRVHLRSLGDARYTLE